MGTNFARSIIVDQERKSRTFVTKRPGVVLIIHEATIMYRSLCREDGLDESIFATSAAWPLLANVLDHFVINFVLLQDVHQLFGHLFIRRIGCFNERELLTAHVWHLRWRN